MSNSLRFVVSILLLFSFLIMLGGCTSSDKIKIGVLLPVSGPFGSWGEDMLQGVSDGFEDTELFVLEDTTCDPANAVSAYKKLTDIDKVSVIIGPACGSPQQAIFPLIKQEDQLVLFPNAAASGYHVGSDGKIYQLLYTLEDESAFLANHLNREGKNRIALVSYQNDYSRTHYEGFVQAYQGEIVEDLVFSDFSDDISNSITRIKAADVDAVVALDLSYFFAGAMKKLAEQEVSTEVYGLYAVEHPAALSMVEGVKYSFPEDLDGDKGAMYILGREAAELIKEAMLDCNDVSCMRDSLSSSERFDAEGVSTRGIVLKQMINGTPIFLE